MRSRPGSPIRAVVSPPSLAPLVLSMVLALGACSGDDEGAEPDAGTSQGGTTAQDDPGIDTSVEVGEVVGRLGERPARDAAAEVASVVDRWIDAAYVGGDYPRSGFDEAFDAFTPGAARLATDQRGLMSNAGVGEDVDSVTARRRVVRVDLLAPKGKPAGATAHLDLVLDLAGDVERTDRVRGRLLLTPTKNGWRIFGFDIERGEVNG